MFRVGNPQSVAGRFVKIGVSVSICAMVAACSSASSRFGPTDATQAKNDPGYDTSQNSVYTGSLQNNSTDNGDFNRDVAATPLNDPTQAKHQTVSMPAANNSVVVQRGDTLYSISRAYGVEVGDLIAINNIQPPHDIKTGQSLVLPGNATRTHVASAPQATVSPVGAPIIQTAVPGTHKVKNGQTLYSISKAYGHTPDTVAAHNRIREPYTLKVGQNLQIPAKGHVKNASYTPQTVPNTLPAAPVAKAKKPAPSVTEMPVPTTKPTQKADRQVQKNAPLPKMTSSKFRWPVKGRIISPYGAKPSGGRNDGINIAVPEGTSVKAAENGVVAYAGNELKGYGNLVLIRHANNWVTAYAHNKELFVRRGDTIKRGQIIAKAGKTGSVKTPQLHFEIRKGAQAVDPTQYLSPNSYAGG